MKILFRTVKSFIIYNKTFCCMLGLIIFFALVGVCSCSPGEINAPVDTDDCADKTYPVVSGVYEIYGGTQEVITVDDQEIINLEGSFFAVSQNKGVVSAIGCLGQLSANGSVECMGSENWNIDSWYGPYVGFITGKLDFNSESTLVVKMQIIGHYTQYEFSYTINLDLRAWRIEE